MVLSRTTSRLFSKAPTYTRPAPYAGPATPWGLSEQRNAVGPDGRPTPYPDRLKAYYNYARPFVNPGNGVNMADVMQMNVRGTYPPGQDLFDMPWSPPDTQGPVIGVSPQNPTQTTQTGPSASPHNFMQSPVNMSGFQNKPMTPTLRQFGQMPAMQQVPPVPAPATFVGPQNPMQPPVNMSGLQGAPMVQGMGVAGLMPGFGGMASQGYMAALGKGYSASSANPMPNPMMSQALPGQGEAVRRLNAINDTPSPVNSLQASAISQGSPMSSAVAGMSNGYYSPPSSVNQGRQYGLTLPMDLAGQQNRIANQNPMYAGMQSRFGSGSVMGQQAAMIAQNEGAGNIRIPGSYGEMPTYIQKGESPEVRYRSNANGDQVSFNSNNDPVLTRQQAALRNFTPDAQRGQNRKAAREATKARLADSRFKMQVSRGLNPNSAKAKAMFPEQVAKMQGSSPNNPMAQAGPPGSLEDMQLASDTVVNNLSGANPHFNLIGATPDSTLSDISSGITAHIAGGGALSDDSLKSFQEHARALSRMKPDKDPFDFNTGVMGSGSKEREGRLWRDLASLPDTPEARRDWLSRYKSRDAQLSRPEDPNSQEAIDRKRAEDSLRRYPPRAGA